MRSFTRVGRICAVGRNTFARVLQQGWVLRSVERLSDTVPDALNHALQASMARCSDSDSLTDR
jgi:hypothetical protein